MFVGTVAARAVGQQAHDLYLTDNWGPLRPRVRHRTTCIAPGIVFNAVEREMLGGQFQPTVAGAFSVRYINTGTIYVPLIPPVPIPGAYLVINGVIREVGHVLTWLDELDEQRVLPARYFWYHQHDKREAGQLAAPPILAQNVGTQKRFTQLHIGSQIQSYRSI
ncbi:hypothetical protein C8R47DRAFT_1079074 [Mycena vitilis]|nr:hypothetical protein C8R47DRAFT_1079074 [Mycena vitilis]